MRRFYSAVVLFCLSFFAMGQNSRTVLNFDSDWKFQLGDVEKASEVSFNDKAWRVLDLPHDWSIEGENLEDAPGGGSVGYFPSGIGWYRKTFNVKSYSSSKLYSIEFDGIYMNSEVWLNGHYLGKWPYGYSSFSYDLTPYLKARGNVIAVKVDNSKQPNSRWYTGSGIYRHVRLVSTQKLRFDKWGVFGYTDNVDGSKAVVKIESNISNDSKYAAAVVRHSLVDAEKNVVATVEAPLTLTAGAPVKNELLMTVESPRLWDIEDPYMYTLRSQLLVNGKEVDVTENGFGIRTILYDVDKGFFLNGKSVKMKGVNLHHDAGAVGAAVPERVWERRIEILKSGGCNAIRTAHNIPSPEFLDLCDKHGMLVMDEVFDMWQAGKNKFDYQVEFDEWHERDLACMVMRDRNHPSVVMWSIGNEVPDQSTVNGPMLAREMIKMCHDLDPTRLVTSGNDRIVADDNPASEEFLAEFKDDIVGYNYPDRWGKRRETNYTEDKIRFPDRRVVATEAGGIGGSRGVIGRGRYPGRNIPASASYIDVEQRWKYTLNNDFVIGDFMWTGIDYYGETRWPSRGAGSGYLDNCGFKKDGYYFFKSIWTEEPVLHLVGGWNPAAEEVGKIKQVVVFTNMGYVELFVNGKSYGVKSHEYPRLGNVEAWYKSPEGKVQTSTADLHLTWDVDVQPGEVKLVGRVGDKEYVEVFRTAGEPAALRVSLDRDVIKADPTDVAHVIVEVVDANGNVVPSANNLVKFSVPGAKIIGVESGNMSDLSSTKASERKAFAGMCMAIVQAEKPGTYKVNVSAEGLAPVELILTAE